MNLEDHLKRQIAFSRATFGPGARMKGVVRHIASELAEVEESGGAAGEWVDVVILAFDGLTRSLLAIGMDTDEAARTACRAIVNKQSMNEARDWPDWRHQPFDRPIEHIRAKADD